MLCGPLFSAGPSAAAVEVVGGEKTSEAILEKTCDILSKMHKKPVRIPIEVPAHAGNRLQGALGRENHQPGG